MDSIRAAAPVWDEDLIGTAASPEARRLLASILVQPHATEGGKVVALPDAHRPRRLRSLPAVAAAIVAVVAAASMYGTLRPSPAAAGIEIRQEGEWLVATVTDLNAKPEEMRRAFLASGLDVDLKLVPASPSRVGTIVALVDDGSVGGIDSLNAPGCAETGCGPLGVRIPMSYRGHAEITLGREAKPGEAYVSVTSALAPGEALHCSGLIDLRVRDAATELARRGVKALWNVEVRPGRWENMERPPASILDWYVENIHPKSVGEVIVRSSDISLSTRAAERDPRIGEYLAQLQAGCFGAGS